MLHVLRQQALDGVLATVVRYFGGVKLGAGGLVRAYTHAVAQALLQARKVPVTRWAPLTCTLPYALEGAVRRALDAAAVRKLSVHHTETVLVHFEVAAEAAALMDGKMYVNVHTKAHPGGEIRAQVTK